jgi:hypothetical protein
MTTPPFGPHRGLNPLPNNLANLPISKPSRTLDTETSDACAPPFDYIRNRLTIPTNVEPADFAEELNGVAPLIAAELPGLTSGKDSDHTVPIVWFEFLGGVDYDEAHGLRRVDGREMAGDMVDLGVRARK